MNELEKKYGFTRRSDLHLTEELDSEINREVRRTGIPKAVLIRTILMRWLHKRKTKFIASSDDEGKTEVGWL